MSEFHYTAFALALCFGLCAGCAWALAIDKREARCEWLYEWAMQRPDTQLSAALGRNPFRD